MMRVKRILPNARHDDVDDDDDDDNNKDDDDDDDICTIHSACSLSVTPSPISIYPSIIIHPDVRCILCVVDMDVLPVVYHDSAD